EAEGAAARRGKGSREGIRRGRPDRDRGPFGPRASARHPALSPGEIPSDRLRRRREGPGGVREALRPGASGGRGAGGALRGGHRPHASALPAESVPGGGREVVEGPPPEGAHRRVRPHALLALRDAAADRDGAAHGDAKGDAMRRSAEEEGRIYPGGQAIRLPPSTWKCRWKTAWPA